MQNVTFWAKNAPKPVKYPAFPDSGEHEFDVCVIGGGIAGIACAYEHAVRGASVCVLEAHTVGGGDTQNSTAIISVAHDLVYDRLIKKHGLSSAAEYLRLQQLGLDRIAEIIADEKIDCDFARQSLVVFSTTACGARKIDRELAAFNMLGYSGCASTDAVELPARYTAAMSVPNQAVLNPLKFIRALAAAAAAKGVKIYENTLVATIPENGVLKIRGAAVRAKSFIVATHFPYITFPGLYFLKIYQHRSHNIVYSSDLELASAYESAEDKGFEYRSAAAGHLLIGGANIRTGKYSYHSQYQKIRAHAARMGLDVRAEAARFSAQDCMTFDFLSYAGRYGVGMEDVFVVSGFNKWGFTNAFACADIICRLTGGTLEDANNLFSPSRGQFFAAPLANLAHVGDTVANFAEYVLSLDAKKLSRIKNGQGAVIHRKGKRVGVYRDGKGKLHAVSAVCAHLGCPLRWNKDELTWDCRCHGSRYDIDGNALCAPTVKPLHKADIE